MPRRQRILQLFRPGCQSPCGQIPSRRDHENPDGIGKEIRHGRQNRAVYFQHVGRAVDLFISRKHLVRLCLPGIIDLDILHAVNAFQYAASKRRLALSGQHAGPLSGPECNKRYHDRDQNVHRYQYDSKKDIVVPGKNYGDDRKRTSAEGSDILRTSRNI